MEYGVAAKTHCTGRRRALPFIAVLALCLFVFAGCGKKRTRVPTPPTVTQPPSKPSAKEPVKPAAAPDSKRTVEPGGEVGVASWYGHPFHGRRTANGEVYDMDKFTAAHKTRSFNTWVRVHNLDNGKTVDVRINDRGPFVDGRVIDLSRVAARAIDMIGPGTAIVRLERVPAPDASPGARDEPAPPPAETPDAEFAVFGVQAGAFSDRDRAERIRAQLEQEYGSARLVLREGEPPIWRVIVGPQSDPAAAEALAKRVRAEYGPAFVISLGNPPAESEDEDGLKDTP